MTHPDVIVIGAGHNGLLPRRCWRRRGLKTLVLERTDRVGGCARSGEIAPGFVCPTLAHAAAIDPGDHAARSGWCGTGCGSSGPAATPARRRSTAGRSILWHDAARAAQQIRAFSAKDAEQYPRFLTSVARISGVLRAVAGVAAAVDRRSRPPPTLIALLQDRTEVPRARQARRLPACCAGCRWRPPTSSANGSRASRCARRSRPAACSGRSSGRGRPAAPRCCCCSAPAKGTRSRAAGSSSADRARWPTRSSAAARQAGVEIRTGVERRADRCRRRRRLRRHAADRRVDRRARRRLERRSEAHAARPARSDAPRAGVRPADRRTSAPTARWRRSTTPSRRCRGFAGLAALGASRAGGGAVRPHPARPRHRRHRARVRRREVRRLRRTSRGSS